MEKARHRRSRSATSVEGNFQVRQQKVVQSLVSDSYSYSEGISKDDLLTSHFSQNSLKRGSGTPIKTLLAEEMAKEGEPKRRSPNVIARLMGLDGLPSPHHGQRQQKKLFDKNQLRNTSRNIHQNEHLYEDRSSRRSSVDQKDFKDVYEDLEASHVTNCRYSSKWTMNSGLTKPEMELIQQKFMDAKRLSCSAELQVSKEFDETLEMLDSNKDLLLRYLQQPDSLYIRPLHDPQVPSSRSCYDRKTSLQATNSRAKGWKSERDNAYKYNISSHPKREDGLLLQSHHHSSSGPCNPSRNHLDVKDEGNVLPTRIVVLKPNIGKTSNSITSVSSPESARAHPSSHRKNLERRTAKSVEVASWKKRTSSSGVISSSPRSREDRAFAREVTRQMRENFESFGGGLNILTHSGARGYAGDESSYDAYESDSSIESGGKTVSPSNAFGWNWYTRSSSCRNESLVSKEAKKRMSERWKMTHRCQDVESSGKGSTLGEMLGVPEKETRHETLDAAATNLDGNNENFPCSDNYSGCDSPLGISSREGWKDGCLENSSRSRSLPPSLFSSRSYRPNGRREALVITNETKNLRRSKARRANLSQKEEYSSGDKSSSRNPRPCSDNVNSSPDVNGSLLQAGISHDKDDQQEKDITISQVPAPSGSCTTSITDAVSDAKHESSTLSVDPPVVLLFEHSDNMTENYNSDAHQDTMWLQELPVSQSEGVPSHFPCPGPEPEYSESSKEADHPSPVSVLEVSFVEDVSSSSDCFERVNAELHELRMQLQLLKMESRGCADTPIRTSKIEYVLQQSEIVPEEGCLLGVQSWESCYIDEVLFNAGLEEFNPDTFSSTWHSPDCPLDPWIFDNLEKDYGGETTRLKFERKLLFDRINLALLQMFKHHIDPCPWVKPMGCAANLNWPKGGLKDALRSFLANQEIEVNGENPERVLDREMYWLGFRDDIDIVGKEIEKMLIDDLIGELLTM